MSEPTEHAARLYIDADGAAFALECAHEHTDFTGWPPQTVPPCREQHPEPGDRACAVEGWARDNWGDELGYALTSPQAGTVHKLPIPLHVTAIHAHSQDWEYRISPARGWDDA